MDTEITLEARLAKEKAEGRALGAKIRAEEQLRRASGVDAILQRHLRKCRKAGNTRNRIASAQLYGLPKKASWARICFAGMEAARVEMVKKLGLPPNMSWQEFFDTAGARGK